MPKEEWGVKRICPTTGKRFYDLGRSPVVSPYTGEVVTIDDNPRRGVSAMVSAAAAERTKARATVASDDEDTDILVDDDDTDVEIEEDLLEDDEEDNVSLDDLTDVASDNDDD